MRNTYLSLILMLLLSACTSPNISPNVYSYSEASSSAIVKLGTVISKRDVLVEDLKLEGAEAAGSTVGIASGYAVGKDLPSVLIGGALGYLFAASLPVTEQSAVAYTVRLESNKIIRVIQSSEEDEQLIDIGDKVMVEYSQGMRINLVKL